MKMKIKLKIDRAIVEDTEKGFCYIARRDEGGAGWIELHGNMTEEQAAGNYPLCLENDNQIDEFATHLKTILKGKK